jgi:hypothetical protein
MPRDAEEMRHEKGYSDWMSRKREKHIFTCIAPSYYNIVSRPTVMVLLNEYIDKDIYVFKNREEANKFLSQVSSKIEIRYLEGKSILGIMKELEQCE